MADIKRVFLIVLDSVGIGYARDAKNFGDQGTFTLKSAYDTGRAELTNLRGMGLGNIRGLEFIGTVNTPVASYARLVEASMGKDTTIGHWEIAGHISKSPLPVFPEGFPKELLSALSERIGRGLICNKPYSGTEVIKDYGEEHLRTGDLIVYTSADSVFQIAAHTSVMTVEELYAVCEIARELLCGKYAVGRVIARPFAGDAPDFYRLSERRDFSLEPPVKMLPDAIKACGLDSIAVGKIFDVFAGRGFTDRVATHSNEEGMAAALQLAGTDFSGLCFINLVDFDTLWGHRRDPVGYAEGLSRFDGWLGDFMGALRDDDALLITADHGCDPAFTLTTDHTRENVPLLIYSKRLAPEDLGERDTFSDIAATVCRMLGVEFECDGTPIELREV